MSSIQDDGQEEEQHPPEDEEMRTEELMREYARNADAQRPERGWECLVWHAAALLRLAKQMRNTLRTGLVKPIEELFKQGELFDV